MRTKTKSSELARTIGVVLACWRTGRCLTQQQLAERAGVSVDSILRAETRGIASIESIDRYAKVLGTTASTIVGEAEERIARRLEREAAVQRMRDDARAEAG